MRNRRVYRALAVSSVAILATCTLAVMMRSSEADTPDSNNAYVREASAVDAAPASSAPTNTNRIRFGTQIAAEAAPPAAPVNQPIRVGNRYAVQQAAAEEPLADDRAEAAVDARAPAVPTSSRPQADPFGNNIGNNIGNNVPPVGTMPTPAPPRSALPAAATYPAAAKQPTMAAAPATDSRYGTPSAAYPPANPIPSTPRAAPSAASISGMPSTSTATPPAPFAATQSASIPAAPISSASIPAAPIPAAPLTAREPSTSYATPPTPAAGAYAPVAASPTASQPIASSSSGVGGTGRPGEKGLEGTQSPTLTIEKIAPQEIQVGKPALFEIVVRNVGGATANDVEIHDIVPQGTQLKASNPNAARGKSGELVWLLGAMKPGDEAKVQVELLPTTEGEIGSVANVRFAAAASVRTICTKPELVVEVQMPRTVLAGDDVPVRIRVSNPGTGVATGIFLTEVVPAGMEHTAGGELEYEVGNLQPNESRELELTLRAVKQGSVVNIIQGEGDGTLRSETKTSVEIVAPALTVAIDGPKRRYLDRQATYTVSLSNPGTAAAKEVELATFLPKGMQFVDADNHGEYDAATHSVRWMLEELPAKEKGSVSLTALPIEPGQQLLRVETTAARGVSAKKEEAIMVEGAASINFQVVDTADPIEVGGDTTYEIVVANQGSKEATNVQLTIALPEGMKALDADGPARFNIAARQVTFQALPTLAPKQETTFRVRVQCVAAGDHRCHVQLTSDDMKTPVTKEEGTRVYADE